MSLLTQADRDTLRGPGGYIDPLKLEALVIHKLAGVSMEPVIIRNPIGDDLEVFTATQLAAARVQALEEAAKVCERHADPSAGVMAAAIRTLIGGK